MYEFQATGLDEAIATFDSIEKEQLPFATALTATMTAKDVQKAEKKLIARVFDRPVPFTRNSVRIRSATKRNPTAAVWLKDDWASGFGKGNAAEYLSPHIFGGPRKMKPFEKALKRKGMLKLGQYVVPSKTAKLDRFGNVSRGQIVKAMSNIGAQHDRSQNTTNRNKISYFLFEENDGSNAGIWMSEGATIKPFLLFVDKAPEYKKKFKFFEMADRTIQKRVGVNFQRAMNQALTSAITRRKRA